VQCKPQAILHPYFGFIFTFIIAATACLVFGGAKGKCDAYGSAI
jgi:hypothetical protein